MSEAMDTEEFLRKATTANRAKARQLQFGAETEEEWMWEEGDYPVLEPPTGKNQHDNELTELIKNTNLLELYRRLNPGSKEGSRRGAEILVQCPHPDHEDRNKPSARINTDKNVGICFHDWVGFDAYDLYAWYAGYDVPGYKTDGNFRQVRDELADLLGYRVHREPGLELIVPNAPTEEAPDEPESDDDEPEDDDDSVIQFPIRFEAPPPEIPKLDFLDILGPDSLIIRPFVERLQTYPFPDEYHGWLALQAIGFALGNKRMLSDHPLVRGNLMVCLVGSSGKFKSSSLASIRPLLEAIDVDLMGLPKSDAALYDMFGRPIPDPADPSQFIYEPVAGLVQIEELASLIISGQRKGNDTPNALMYLYDSPEPRTSPARTNTAGKGHAENHFMQVIATTQPDRVADLLNRADKTSGFLNRWIFAFGTDKGNHPGEVWRPRLPDMSDLADVLVEIRGWAAMRPFAEADQDAKDLLIAWNRDVFKALPANDMFTRVILTMKKLALLISADKKEEVIGVESMRQALAFWDYLKASYGFVDTATEETADDPREVHYRNKILACAEQLASEGQVITQAKLKKMIDLRTWNNNLTTIDRAMKTLVASGILVRKTELPPSERKPGAQPKVRYELRRD